MASTSDVQEYETKYENQLDKLRDVDIEAFEAHGDLADEFRGVVCEGEQK